MIKKLYWWAMITAVLLLSIQILGLVIYIYSFIPYPAFWNDAFSKGVEPKRDTLFFGIFLTTSVVLMAMGIKWLLPRFSSPDTRRKFKLWLALEGGWCFLMVFCFFKWTTYRYPFWNILPFENSAWLQPFFIVVCVMSLLSKVFFPEVERFYAATQAYAGRGSWPRWLGTLGQIIFIAAVFGLLYIPRPQEMTALALAWDQWNHLDRFTGWFIKQGCYISYGQSIQILVMLAVVYIVGLFYFIRLWLKSWLLAAIGALLAVKMGMFYYACAPGVWINPANTFLAHGWDIALFFGLWFCALKHPKKVYGVSALVGAFLIYWWFKGNGYIDALGYDDQPLMAPLRVRQFFPFFMGYFVPVFYVLSLLVLMGQKKDQSPSEGRLPVIICCYGLLIFVDYLEHPAIGYYGALIVPAILMMLWWLKQGLASSELSVQRVLCVGGLLLVTGALMTNRLMLIYPDMVYQDPERFAKEKIFEENFDNVLRPSAALIGQLTREDQPVALLSNFETALLMKAHRKPLFRDFPVMVSSLNSGAGALNLKTKAQGLELIDSLSRENALYVFVDDRLLALPPQALAHSGLNAVLSYLQDHYQEFTRQGFLTALQRK